MQSEATINDWLFQCPGGFLFYEQDAGYLHLFNESGLLVWNLLRAGIAAEPIARHLASIYGLPQPPFEDVRAVTAVLDERGLMAGAVTSGGGAIPAAHAEVWWPPARQAIERAVEGGIWQSPSIFSLPVDGLHVTSAKCSSRFVNLDDNTRYAPSSVDLPAG